MDSTTKLLVAFLVLFFTGLLSVTLYANLTESTSPDSTKVVPPELKEAQRDWVQNCVGSLKYNVREDAVNALNACLDTSVELFGVEQGENESVNFYSKAQQKQIEDLVKRVQKLETTACVVDPEDKVIKCMSLLETGE